MDTLEENISLENSNNIDVYTQENINHYYHNKAHIGNRLRQLKEETSIEQIFAWHDAANVAGGVLLSLVTRKKSWLALPLLVTVVQSVHALYNTRFGTELLRKYGFRTKADIEKEKYALKVLRGDFHYEIEVPNAVWEAVNK